MCRLITAFLLILVSRPLIADYTSYYEECHPFSLEESGASNAELRAFRAITRDYQSKGPFDVIRVSPQETAVGIAHFTAERDPFRLGLTQLNVHHGNTLKIKGRYTS